MKPVILTIYNLTKDTILFVVFFHYVEPDHWYFTKGPEHIYEIYKEHAKGETNEQ